MAQLEIRGEGDVSSPLHSFPLTETQKVNVEKPLVDLVGTGTLVSPNKLVCSWFELSEENSDYEVEGDHVSEKSVSPRTLLKVVDEALEFELSRLGDTGDGEFKPSRSLSEREPEDELEELTNK